MRSLLLFFLVTLLSAFAVAQTVPTLPVNFDDPDVGYTLLDFGGNSSAVEVDPTDASNSVARSTKTAGSELWAGTTIGGPNGVSALGAPLAFTADATTITVRVWSPLSGIQVRLKTELDNDPTVSVETEATTTVANDWETLSFDFTNQVSGTAALNTAVAYDKLSIFFNFGNVPTADETYYWDDVVFTGTGGGGGGMTDRLVVPLDFESDDLNYGLFGFGGASASRVADPTDAGNNVIQIIKDNTAQTWGGMSTEVLEEAIPFTADDQTMTMRVWAPTAGMTFRLKVENGADGAIFAEADAVTTVAMAWETLTFDFSTAAAAVDLNQDYTRVAVFPNFGVDGATAGEITSFIDDIELITAGGGGGGGGMADRFILPIDFESSTINYGLYGFGNATTARVADPTNVADTVAQITKPANAEPWAGVALEVLEEAINVSTDSNTMTMRIWSPAAGLPILFKIENGVDNTIFVQTTTNTTVAGAWETLTFDLTQNAAADPAIDYNAVYSRVVVFPNFGTNGATAGEQTFLFDDITLAGAGAGGGGGGTDGLALPVDFDDSNIDYMLADFGGNGSSVVEDPTDAANSVVQSVKGAGAELWAGTSLGRLAMGIPFDTDNNTISVRVWSPDAGITVRLKAEAFDDPTISVETDEVTTVAMAWDTLTFDFTDEVDGTAAINYASVYDKLSIFFNFGVTGATAGEKTYFWDDVTFGEITSGGGGGGTADRFVLPIDFESSTINYGFYGFGNATAAGVVDPTDADNTVMTVTKPTNAEPWAGVALEVLEEQINVSPDSNTMTMRVWSPAADLPILFKIENGDDNSIFVQTTTNTTVAQDWETLTFDLTQNAAGEPAIDYDAVYSRVVVFPNFGTNGADAGEQTFYFDDITLAGMGTGGGGGGGLAEPMEAAPAPTRPASTVISLFSDEYTDVPVDTWRTDWSNADFMDIDIQGNPTKFYSNLGFVGIETTGDNAINLTDNNMTHLHLDVWTPNMDTLLVKLVDWGMDGFDNGTDTEAELAFLPIQEQWNSLDIPLTDFAGMNQTDINQIILSSRPFGTGVVYVDNFYFYNDMVSTRRPQEGVLTAFPNPVREALNVVSPTRMERLVVTDMSGRRVAEHVPNAERFVVPTQDLAPGMYFVTATAGDERFVLRFIRE